MIQKEKHILEKSDHLNIVRLYEVIETRNFVFFVLEYLEGGDLLHFIKANTR